MQEELAANGTRLTRKGLATRERIIELAADLIRERGVNKTSIEDVRAAASVSGSQMTHYFRDKRSLVRAVIAWRSQQLDAFHQQPKIAGLNSFPALKAWADASVRSLNESDFRSGCSFSPLAGELVDADDELRDDLAAALDRWVGALRVGLADMRGSGLLRTEADPGRLAIILLAAHQGGCLLAEARRDSKALRDALYGAISYVYSFAAEGVESPLPKRWVPTLSGRAEPAGARSSARRASRVS
jgi:TetR/AcrR family transcriptional repressor of nem operon